MLNLCRSSKHWMYQRHNLWLFLHWLGFEQATYDKCILSFEMVRRIVNQDITSHLCSSENLGVVEADVGSCKQLNLLTRIRPCKKLKVNAEDFETPPKSLLKEIEVFKMLHKESLQKHEKKKTQDFPSGPWLTLHLPMIGVWVPSLVRTLRSACLVARKKQTKKQERYCNKFNKGFKNGPY